jgi:hypothetical protein
MTEQPKKKPLAAVEADLFGTIFGFHKKFMTLLRESSLDDEKQNVVADRIKALFGNVTSEMDRTQQLNVAERLEAIYDEARRLVDELSQTDDGKKAKPRTRRLKGQKNKP